MDPVDWRAREWNKGADHLATYALQTGRTGGTLDAPMMKASLQQYFALQFYSDGGFVHGRGGAAGIQLLGYSREGGVVNRCVIGYYHIFEPTATSAFQMELLGLERALAVVVQASR